jgi:hypothetical protein
MCKYRVLLFACLCFTGIAYSQVAPQIIPVLNKRKNITAVRILDTINTDTRRIIVNQTVTIPEVDNVYPPNYMGKSMMTPTAWGSEGGGYLFAGLGGTFPAAYTARPDMIGVIGLAAGDPRKAIGGIATLNVNDVSRFRNYSSNLMLHKRLTETDAVAVGGIHLFPTKRTDAHSSYYLVYSHAVQNFIFNDADFTRLNYSIGVGNGRFYEMSRADSIRLGKSRHGTLVFGNVSFGLTRWANANVEWSGINLHTSLSLRPLPMLPVINIGLADLTRYSGDRIRFVASIYYAYPLWD